jgi:hypothetical protein
MTFRAIAPDELDDSETLCQNRLATLHYQCRRRGAIRERIIPAILIA